MANFFDNYVLKIFLMTNITNILYYVSNQQWRSGSALETGRRKLLRSIPGRACRTSRSEFSVVFSETRVNTD